MPLKTSNSTIPVRTCSAYPTELRRQAVALHAEGFGAKRIGKTLGIDSSIVKEWLRRYKKYGENGLQPFWRKLQPSEKPQKKPETKKAKDNRGKKYKEALKLYSETSLTMVEICRRCKVNYGNFVYYVNRPAQKEIKAQHLQNKIAKKEQAKSLKASQHNGARRSSAIKYADAIELLRTTDKSMCRVAEECRVSLRGLRRYCKLYHEDIISERAKLRSLRGVSPPRPEVVEYYREAVELYKTTTLSATAIARQTGIDSVKLCHYLRTRHRGLILERMGIDPSKIGEYMDLSLREICKKRDDEKYAKALDRLKLGGTAITIVTSEFGLERNAFRRYLVTQSPELVKKLDNDRSTIRIPRQKTIEKYENAVNLYKNNVISLQYVAEQMGLKYSALRSYVSRNYPGLVAQSSRIMRPRKTSQALTDKYKDALKLYIETDISRKEVCRRCVVNYESFSKYLRKYYPHHCRSASRRKHSYKSSVAAERLPAKVNAGINECRRNDGIRPRCVEQYSEAIEMLRNTTKTLRQVAEECSVSFSGLRSYYTKYHKDVVELRAGRRKEACNSQKLGELNGSGTVNQPKRDKVEQYRDAVEMYRTTLLPLTEISKLTNVPLTGLTYHLYRWHRNLVLKRKGITPDGHNEYMDLSRTKHYLKSTQIKYAVAIRRLKNGEGESIAQVAAEFGFHPETFRDYISKHEPRLAKQFGQTRLQNGKVVLSRSSKKYEEAIRLYITTKEPLKTIAQRLGLVYNSLSGFVRRNCPEVIEQHNRLVESQSVDAV